MIFFIEQVIPRGSPPNHFVSTSNFSPNYISQLPNPLARTNSLAVHNTSIQESTGNLGIRINPSYHKRSKIIPLTTFVDSEVRFKHFRLPMLLIAQTRLTNHFGLENKFHKFLSLFSLNQNFGPFPINRDIKFPSFSGIKSVFLFLEIKAAPRQAVFQDRNLLI